jgi:hypothetical protein
MSESAQPLSRRERRAMEEAARAAEGDETQALPVAPETLDTLSRRERRRLERLAHPIETWTEEEELIATGQLPAMTPEVLAEQDRLVAQAAEADAAAARAYAETAAEADAVVEEAEEVTEAPAPVAQAPAPLPTRHHEPEPSFNEIPADLRHLFPPGSLQARAFEAQQAAAAPQEEHNDAVDEIRRLTQEAMAGITKATTGPVEAVAEAEPEPAPVTEAEAPVDEAPAASAVPDLPGGVDVEALWNAPTVDEPVRPLTPAFPDADPEPVTLSEVPLVNDVPAVSQPTGLATENQAPVWSALVPANPAPAPAQQPGPAQQQMFEPVSFAPVTSPTEPTQAAPTMWDTHPLTNPGATPVRELPTQAPPQDLPRPDLSVLLGTQPGPSVGQAAYLSTEPSTSTTSVPLRPAEPRAGGGARHFRWAHLAVIGAIAFVLGVLAWNIARSGS